MYALKVFFNLFYLYSENALDILLLISPQCHIQGLHIGNSETGHDRRIYTMAIIKHYKFGNPLASQWLGFHISTVGSMAIRPGRGTKIPQASGSKTNKQTPTPTNYGLIYYFVHC